LSALEGIKMKKKYFFLALFVALFSFSTYSTSRAFAQERKNNIAQVSFKDYFEKGKSFSKDKWSNFQTVRDNYFEESIEAKGLTFVDENGNQVEKAYFSISSKLRINPVIKITDEDGNEIKVSSWRAHGKNSKFAFIKEIGYSRAKTSYSSGENLLLPNDKYYVLALRVSKDEKNSQEIWPVPVSKSEFNRLKKSAIGEKVKPIDGYNY
jgi:hypothetical protein